MICTLTRSQKLVVGWATRSVPINTTLKQHDRHGAAFVHLIRQPRLRPPCSNNVLSGVCLAMSGPYRDDDPPIFKIKFISCRL